MLTLYPDTLLKVLIRSKSFLVESLSIGSYNLQIRIVKHLFLLVSLLFLFCALFLWLRIQALYWIRVETVSILSFKKMFSVFLHWICCFIALKYVHSIPTLFRAFYHEKMSNFVKSFFYWDDHMIFVLDSNYVMYYFYWSVYAEQYLHPWNETKLIMVYDLF
jgi:hypothetical protein